MKIAAKCIFSYKVRVRYIHPQAAVCLNSVVVVGRSGSPAAGMGLREKCDLGAVFFPRASLFSAFLRYNAQSSRAISLVIVIFRLVVHFHVLPRAGPACAGSASRPLLCSRLLCELLLCELRAAGGCASAEPGGAYFLSSFRRMLVVPRANRSFQHVFGFSRRRRESVCHQSVSARPKKI